MTTDAGQQQQASGSQPLDLNRSSSADFAIAFGGGEEALKAAVNGAAPAAATTTQQQKQEPDKGQGQQAGQGEDDEDPYKDIDVNELLKSKSLGPKLNQWADRAHIAQVRAAEARARTEGETAGIRKGREQLTAENEDKFFRSLTPQELAAELAADPELSTQYAQYLERQKGGGAGGSKDGRPDGMSDEDYANAVATTALGVQIQATLDLLNEAELSDEVRAELDPNKFVDRGTQGFIDWQKSVQAAIAKAEGAKQVQSVTSDADEAAIQRRNAADDRARPGAMRPGQTSQPVPDLMKVPLKNQFDMAFGAGAPRKV